jgi:Tol biopolymer transport system component
MTTSFATIAQEEDDAVCAQFVESAFSELGTNCANLGPNEACYGFGQIQATFADTGISFASPRDSADLTSLQTIGTNALAPASSEWGIAMMNVHADIHRALDETAVYLMFGDVIIENDVAPENVVVPGDPIAVQTANQASLYAGPGAGASVIGSVPGDLTLQTDAVNPAGDRLRVLYLNQTAWININDLDPDTDVSTLPTMGPDSFTPLQAFRFRTGFDAPACEAAPPSGVAVQSPDSVPIYIIVNGVDMRISARAMIFMRSLPNNIMEVITLTGQATLYPGTAGELQVPHAHAVRLRLDLDGYAFEVAANPEIVTPEEMELFAPFEWLPGNILRWLIKIIRIILGSGIGGVIPIIEPAPIARPSWTPIVVGPAVCCQWTYYESDLDGDRDIWRLGGQNSQDIDNNISQGPGSIDIFPTAAWDCEWVAFVSDRDATGEQEIWVAKGDGSYLQRLTYNPAVDTDPAWGPDGMIAFESDRFENQLDIYAANVQGNGEPIPLTRDLADDKDPFWSSDGIYVFFTSIRDGDWEVFSKNIVSGELEQITDNNIADLQPIISNDGKKMAWLQRDAANVNNLWLMDLGTGETVQLTDIGDVDGHVFSTDDSIIAFHSQAGGNTYDVYVVDIETGQIKNVTDSPDFNDLAPTFWCDTLIILYQSDSIASDVYPGQFEIFEIDPMPLDGPANTPTRLTNRPDANDRFPENDPREENSSMSDPFPNP